MAEFIMVGLLAVMYLGLGMPLAGRKIGRNRSYGFRISKYVQGDDDIWFAVNELGGRHMVKTGFILVAVAVLLLLFKGRLQVVKLLLIVSLVVSMAGIFYSWVKCRALAHKMTIEKGYKDYIQKTEQRKRRA